MNCQANGCVQPIKARGYCNTHYARWMRHGTAEKAAPTAIPDDLRETRYSGYYCSRDGRVFSARRKGRHLEERGPLREMYNRVENLEWVTPLENVRHAIEVLGRRPRPRCTARV